MRRIAIINQKGGVGKTTTAVNVGSALARAGHRVLLIDLDPQAHLTLYLGQDPAAGQPGVYEMLTGSASVAKVRRRVGSNLWICSASIDLAGAEVELVSVVGREVLLRDLLDQHAAAGKTPPYDYVLMDCPPSLNVLTLNALCAASEVLIPLQPHYLALQGLSKLLETISLVSKRINPSLKVTGVVVCMNEAGTRLASEVIDDVRSFFDSARGKNVPWNHTRLFHTVIRRNIKLAESPSYGKSIFEYASESNGAEDYQKLAAEVHAPDAFQGRAATDRPAHAEAEVVAPQGSSKQAKSTLAVPPQPAVPCSDKAAPLPESSTKDAGRAPMRPEGPVSKETKPPVVKPRASKPQKKPEPAIDPVLAEPVRPKPLDTAIRKGRAVPVPPAKPVPIEDPAVPAADRLPAEGSSSSEVPVPRPESGTPRRTSRPANQRRSAKPQPDQRDPGEPVREPKAPKASGAPAGSPLPGTVEAALPSAAVSQSA